MNRRIKMRWLKWGLPLTGLVIGGLVLGFRHTIGYIYTGKIYDHLVAEKPGTRSQVEDRLKGFEKKALPWHEPGLVRCRYEWPGLFASNLRINAIYDDRDRVIEFFDED